LNSVASPMLTNPILACDGQGLKRLVYAALQWMEQHTAVVNSLNVFPVPDGDTGTNMYLTLQAAWEEVCDNPDSVVSEIAHGVARGALMGARGNSGVILSQILRGIAQGLDGKEDCNAVEFARALQTGSQVAYQAVIKPVEGTILTVIRESSEAAVQAATQLSDLRELMEYVVHIARDSVARTPTLLPILREAGVVDAGGQGLYIVFEGMTRYLQGQTMVTDQALTHAVDLQGTEVEAGYGYDVQYILEGADLDPAQIRADIAAMGESTLVVGDTTTVKVHVHTPSPGDPLNYGAQLGSLSRVIVENLQEQYQEFILSQAHPMFPAEEQADERIATIVVSPGPGLDKVFQSLGCSAIVQGGQTMNPSIEQLFQAVEETSAQDVIILPNNSNIILAAQQAQALSEKRVRVIPTKTVPQGVSALLAFNYHADLDDNARSMERSASEVRTGEITTAVRDARLNGLQVEAGQIIGLVDGELAVSGHDIEHVTIETLRRMDADSAEILTLYYGQDISPVEAQALAARVQDEFPDTEIEVIEGGQPHYQYIVSAE